MFRINKNKNRKVKTHEKSRIQYNEEGYFIMSNHNLSDDKYLVTVVTPVFNADKFLKKTINSVINQSFGFENIEYILVDDFSTDTSREILMEYASKYENIKAVLLRENSGTPAKPRNLGITLSLSKYITFLDADDWLHKDGIKTLYNILEETGDNYAVGRTIQVGDKESKIIGEQESYKEQRGISPFSIPNIFYHLGPRARMIRTSIIKENKIFFPEMKYAEDKQFFLDVILECKTMSTTKQVIYYLNRLEENNVSLTKMTNVKEKMESNLKVIDYVKKKNLPEDQARLLFNRLYEFDSITRLFNRNHFIKSNNRRSYYEIFEEVLETTKDLNFDISKDFFHPINKVAYNLFVEDRYEDIYRLYQWNKKEKEKQYIIKDNLPYLVVPIFSMEDKYHYIRETMLASFKNSYLMNDKYIVEFLIYGDYVNNVEHLLFRNQTTQLDEFVFEINKIENNTATIEFQLEDLYKIKDGKYSIFVRYNGYKRINISKRENIKFKDKQFEFYTTVNSNLGFKIKKIT